MKERFEVEEAFQFGGSDFCFFSDGAALTEHGGQELEERDAGKPVFRTDAGDRVKEEYRGMNDADGNKMFCEDGSGHVLEKHTRKVKVNFFSAEFACFAR